MLFSEIMLDKQTIDKIRLYQHISQNSPFSMNQIQKIFGFSSTKITNLLNMIQQDLESLGISQPTFQWEEKTTDRNLPLPDNYLLHMTQQGIPFQLLYYTLSHPDATLDDFCQEAYLSRATVMRRCAPLKTFFKKYKIRFNCSKLSFSGNEPMIRILLYCLLWLGSRESLEFRFTEDDELFWEEYAALVDPFISSTSSYIDQMQTSLLVKISFLRMRSGHYICEDLSNLGLNTYPLSERLTMLLTKFVPDSTESQYIYNESNFFVYLFNCGPTYIQANDERIAFAINYLRTLSNPLTHFVYSFESFYSSYLSFSEYNQTIREELLGNIFNMSFALFVFQGHFPSFRELTSDRMIDEYPSKEKHYNEFYHFLRTYSRQNQLPWLEKSAKSAGEMFLFILYPYHLKQAASEKIRVSLLTERNILYIQTVNTFLKDLSFVQLINYTEEGPGDFIVTTSSSFVPIINDIPFFVYDPSEEQESLNHLYRQLRFHYLKKQEAERAERQPT